MDHLVIRNQSLDRLANLFRVVSLTNKILRFNLEQSDSTVHIFSPYIINRVYIFFSESLTFGAKGIYLI